MNFIYQIRHKYLGISIIVMFLFGLTDNIYSANAERLQFELVRGVDPAYIVLARGEHPGVMAAAKDLQRDITKITGVTPNIVHSLNETTDRCVVIGSADCPEGKTLLASVGVSVEELEGKWELFKYEVLNDVGGKDQVLAIAGSNLRGTIFGIYDFEQKHMGVDPLWFWADNEPPHRGELVFDSSVNFKSLKEPTWKYRGWTTNDHPQLIEWMHTLLVQRARYGRYMFVIHPEVFDRFHEAALRLKMNMFTWYFVDVDWKPDWEQLRRTVDRGLFITQHQMEGLGADAGFWDHYWDNHNPEGKPDVFSYLKHPESFREFWSHYVKRLVEFSPHVVWELNLRGWADAPYTELTLPDGGTEKQRAEILTSAIAAQAQLVRELDTNPDLQMMTTLYAEVGRYYDSAWVSVPPEVTTGFSDVGMSGMSYSKKFWTEERDPNRKYGQYFHTQYFGGGPQIAKCTPIEAYLKVNMDAMYERGDTQHMLLAMNELRSQQLEIRGIAEMLWDYPSFDPREYLLRYCREEFGEEAAPKVAALYDAYYKKYPHTIRNDGFKTIPSYYKVMEPLFTIIANLLHIEAGNTDGLVMNYQYDRKIYEQGINDLGEVLEQALTLRPTIPENRRYFFEYEFIDAIRLIRGIYKLGIATDDAIACLAKGDNRSALAALNDARPLTLELYDAFKNQISTDKWRYWYRSSTNKDFYLLYNLYQKARLKLETETMNVVYDIEPQRRPFRGNVVMHDPAKVGDAVYGAQAERINNNVWNGSMHSFEFVPLEGVFQIIGVQSIAGKGKWVELGTDYEKNYSFTLKGKSKVYVAYQHGSTPEWILNEGFYPTGKTLKVGYWGWPYRYQNRPSDTTYDFEVYAKEYPAGNVVLGRNKGIDGGLPYIVLIKPSTLIFENFRDTEFNSHPEEWIISENGGSVKVVDIPDYDGDLRPSIFDLTTVPRYTPLDLRGLKMESTSGSVEASIAEYEFKEPATNDFTIDIRLKAGQENSETGFALLTSEGKHAIEVMLTDKGEISILKSDGDRSIVSPYTADRWYNLKLTVSPNKGEAKIEVQDDQLNVNSSGLLKINTGVKPVNRIKLIHSRDTEDSWIVYNAINAYLN
ncbi:MAG: glycosyl hydrolase 115 family protein [Fermentimonas sp.]|nr:glycosyl hydrolase 115 family protein [Fermentimonas sp.]